MSDGSAPARVATYAAELVAGWSGGRSGRSYTVSACDHDAAVPVYIATSDAGTLALAVATLFQPESDRAADEARAAMEERLSSGLVRGPHLLWVPPRAAVPSSEPEASDFVQRVQQAAAPLQPGERGEVALPAPLQLAKLRDEGGYASVVGGLSRWWTLITERVSGTVHVNSSRIRRAPQSSALREQLFDQIGASAGTLAVGEAVEFDTVEAWTVQRLPAEPLAVTGFGIVQAPPKIDPGDGTLMRRLVRQQLRDANAALARHDADIRGVALVAIYDYAETENIGSFVKSLDPALYATLQLVAGVVDGEVRPIFAGAR
ncbi:MAG: hypothetical protein IVW36_11425 [Dehalococcoidia bacterium]|nr:hypothetical protein [Dehalococcoidia bacterium]